MSYQPSAIGRQPSRIIPRIGGRLFVLMACVLIGCNDTRSDYFYQSLADAEKDGAVDRGWLPDFLPQSSHAIRVVGDLSPSRTWCAFEFQPFDDNRLLKHAKKVDVLEASVGQVPDPYRKWWPPVLKGNLDVGKIERTGLRLYTVETPETSVTNTIWLFALDEPNGRCFFFSRSKGT